jgi:protein SCO1/2
MADNTQRNIRLTFLGVFIFSVCVVSFFVYSITRTRAMSEQEMKTNGAYIFAEPRDIAPFALIDQNGKAFTKGELRGHWSLMFFGFTFCPDVCPTTLAEMAQVIKVLDKKYVDDTRVVFVSVDPVRDTPAKIKPYVEYFNPKFTGVTGEFLALKRFATELNVPFAKVPGGTPENYQIEHGSSVVLINPQGQYAGFFKAPIEAGKLRLTYQSARMSE